MVIFFGGCFWDDGNYVVKCGLYHWSTIVCCRPRVNHCGWREVFKKWGCSILWKTNKEERECAKLTSAHLRSLCCLCICTPLKQVLEEGLGISKYDYAGWSADYGCCMKKKCGCAITLYVLAAAMRIFSTEALSISSSLLAWMTFWTPLKAFFRLSKEAE